MKKITGGQFKRVRLGKTMSVVNTAYVTPRRSARIKSKGSPSPISMKMYSPFCIETPGMEDSFVRLSKRSVNVSIFYFISSMETVILGIIYDGVAITQCTSHLMCLNLRKSFANPLCIWLSLRNELGDLDFKKKFDSNVSCNT